MPPEFTKDDKKFLLKLARDKLNAIFDDEGFVDFNKSELSPVLKRRQGCFVTLTIDGDLRGCIGNILPHYPLYEGVLSNAESAALHDPRFPPLSKTEFENEGFEIEISVLTVPFRVHYETIAELKKILKPNVDGVILRRGGYEATYLPQVWEQLPKVEEFMSSLSMKAGLEKDDWKSDDVEIYNYQAIVFSEREI